MHRLRRECASSSLCCRHARDRLRTLQRSGPGQDFETAVLMLDQGGAALDPIATIHVADAVFIADRCVMNVAADHTIRTVALGFASESLLERADVVYGVLDLELRPLRQRPVRH